MSKYVIFNREGKDHDRAMLCFYSDNKKQGELMHRQDIDKQVKE
jgi:hypothetical protein